MTSTPTDLSHIETWIFDLDNTLYPANAEFFSQIVTKMTDFVSRYLALQTPDAYHLQKQYLSDYGTTLSGLMSVHGMDPAEFLDYVHDVDHTLLTPNPNLRTALSALPGRRLIHTNGSKAHAQKVATKLEIFDLFHGHFGVEDGDFIPKPKREPYDIFAQVFDVDPSRAIFFEDNLRNLEVPKAMGMTTVLIVTDSDMSHEPHDARPAGRTDTADYVDYVTDDLAGWLAEHT